MTKRGAESRSERDQSDGDNISDTWVTWHANELSGDMRVVFGVCVDRLSRVTVRSSGWALRLTSPAFPSLLTVLSSISLHHSEVFITTYSTKNGIEHNPAEHSFLFRLHTQHHCIRSCAMQYIIYTVFTSMQILLSSNISIKTLTFCLQGYWPITTQYSSLEQPFILPSKSWC